MTDTAPAWHPEQPHNQLPALPPAHELETRAVLKACIEARAALAELKQAAQLIPNQTMLINTIPLLEAKDSSEIENIVTTTDQLFQYAQGYDNADPATKEALRYRTALHQGFGQTLRIDGQPAGVRAVIGENREDTHGVSLSQKLWLQPA